MPSLQCVIIILVVKLIHAVMMDDDKCPVTERGCSCTTNMNKINSKPGWQIICNRNDQKSYSVEYDSDQVQLECASRVPYKPNMYRGYGISTTKYIFSSCPLPNITLSDLLNATDIQSLFFSCDGCRESGKINSSIFDGLGKLTDLTLIRFHFPALTRSLFEYTINLSSLTLDWNQIKSLSSDCFASVNKLEYLCAANNLLEEIPRDLFSNLTRLKKLYLNNNRIKYLSKETFGKLVLLQELNLKDNLIESLEPLSFVHNVNLNIINLGGNSLEELPGRVFANMSNISWIDLTSNPNLSIIDEDVFGSLPSLTDLYFSNCNVSSWPENVLSGLSNLQHLDMSYNGILELPENLYYGNVELISLELSFNEIATLPPKIFQRQFALQILTIRKNSFKELPKDTFGNLFKLNTLNMDGNFIDEIQIGDLDYLFALETLSLKNNSISTLHEYQTFGLGLARLQEIDLSYNQLTELVDVNWNIYTGLNRLDLSYNRIRNFSIPRLYSKGTEINLMNNQITFVNCQDIKNVDAQLRDVATSMRLQNYYDSNFRLSNNPFSCDCHLLDFKLFITCPLNSYRKKLFPDSNAMTCSQPMALVNQTLLSVPDDQFICPVQKNCPFKCDCYLKAKGRQTIVDCSNSGMKRLPKLLPYNATTIYFTNNSLTSLWGMENESWDIIRELYLDNNLIMANEWVLPTHLKTLSLTGNQLTWIPQTLTSVVTKNKVKLYLGNNPWACNCSTMSIRNLLSFQSDCIKDFLNITCATPLEFRGRTMENLTESEVCPFNQTYLLILSVIGGLVVIIAFTLCVLYYRNKQTIVAYLYIHYFKIYSIFFKEDLDEDKYYHAFISYSSSDKDIAMALLEELENKEPAFKLCIHERDWEPGNLITFNIAHSVQNSRRTIIVLTEDFIKSVWFQLEFHIAYYQMLQDKIDRLIVIVKGKLPEKDKLDKDLQILLTTKTYLEWGEKWFWEKLKYALPHRKIMKSRVEIPQNPSTALVRKIEDKIMNLTAESLEPKTIERLITGNNRRNSSQELNRLEILNNTKNCLPSQSNVIQLEPKNNLKESIL